MEKLNRLVLIKNESVPQLVGLNGPFIDNHLHILIYKAAINLLPPYLCEGIHIKSVGTYSLSAVNCQFSKCVVN